MTSTPAPASTLALQTGLPVVVIGAGPVGLAAAAHLTDRGLTPLVLEAGDHVGAAMRAWGHIRTFTPWQYIVDPTAEKLLAPTGWTRPAGDVPPAGAEVVADYLEPLADVLGDAVVRTGTRVVAVTRDGLDKSRTLGREQRPFLVRVQDRDDTVRDVRAAAVIDASGTWGQRNPLGASGLPAVGEAEAEAAGVLVGPLPDVLVTDRDRFAGRRTLVVGMGHSAANTLLNLAQLAREEPGTEVVWAIRSTDARRLFGGGEADQLPDRGKLGTDLHSLVLSGAIEHHAGFAITGLELTGDGTVTVVGQIADGERRMAGVHNVAAATGFRPDVAMLSEVRLDLDAGLEAPRQLAPLVDPAFHSCGTVPPHGHRELAHPGEPGFYVVGMKSYGRAPTFLITTGNEQVRSIAAHLAGDDAAADEVQLVLPETGVCSVTLPLTDDDAAAPGGSCCGTAPAAEVPAEVDAAHAAWANGEARIGFATGVEGGRAADIDGGLLPLTQVRSQVGGSCCG
ncbi:NAD(P)-binding domain-containing protein [Blastococcus sp. KM273128]|uniref:NAD(P)-binding domain-containing protein n=1 Tax=Blastococcus sp. KM273128 TaxID=2570314 RepID=UPI001F33DAE3|nr:NAD(P)-binding domain-containing protein [Blastococcus sp. KM273128]